MIDAIIYIHSGDSPYLKDSFTITRKHNPTIRMILIGDISNCYYAKLFNMEFYSLSEVHLDYNYYHISVNTEPYEKMCFSRWLIINHFVQLLNIQNVLYSDSDNVFFMDVNLLHSHYSDPDILFLGNDEVCVPNVFYAKQVIFQYIADYIKLFYSRPSEDIYQTVKQIGHYINEQLHYSDMWLIRDVIVNLNRERQPIYTMHLALPHLTQIYNIEHSPILPFVINSNFHSIYKSITLNDKVPYTMQQPLFNLHFCGDSKSLMKNYQ